TERSNLFFMYFSRNPFGLKTSCIEVFAVVVSLSPARLDVSNSRTIDGRILGLACSLELSSTGTYFRSAAFAAEAAFPAAASLPDSLSFLIRSSPWPGQASRRSSYDSIPFSCARPSCFISLPPKDVSFSGIPWIFAMLHSSLRAKFNERIPSVFLSTNWQNASQPDRGVPDASQQIPVFPGARFCSRFLSVHASPAKRRGWRWWRRLCHREFYLGC